MTGSSTSTLMLCFEKMHASESVISPPFLHSRRSSYALKEDPANKLTGSPKWRDSNTNSSCSLFSIWSAPGPERLSR